MIRTISRFIKLLILLGFVLAGTFVYYATQPLGLRHSPIDFDIAPGDSMRVVSQRVAEAGVKVWPPLLTWTARFSGHSVRVKAGSYRIEQDLSLWELVELLSTGSNSYTDITIVEGWNFAHLRAAMDANPDLRHDTLGLSDNELMNRLGLAPQRPEGLFFPDTYSFARGGSDTELLKRAYQRMAAILDREWQARNSNLPVKSPYEALTLASVVEKETGKAEDRPLIASVFVNRLKIKMPLQSDPTVIYGMGPNFDGNLHKRDLQADTPFNTYTRPGLPPTPISLPGVAALRASLQPRESNYLYFVARGDGSSKFSRTLEEHNSAVMQYQKAGKK
ncbi:endolytic transglycosylase MltG [Uliginosibacterium gangwonense]|uniref:endolytic transglycosylase MltG n=1 Tax=Uliginosibacterium gangwonense TaxID=392736 RepID=UPI0004771CFB|nr:endolytic transglycosylase MltG [Uliginosibacterium gangwonense]